MRVWHGREHAPHHPGAHADRLRHRVRDSAGILRPAQVDRRVSRHPLRGQRWQRPPVQPPGRERVRVAVQRGEKHLHHEARRADDLVCGPLPEERPLPDSGQEHAHGRRLGRGQDPGPGHHREQGYRRVPPPLLGAGLREVRRAQARGDAAAPPPAVHRLRSGAASGGRGRRGAVRPGNEHRHRGGRRPDHRPRDPVLQGFNVGAPGRQVAQGRPPAVLLVGEGPRCCRGL
mmetsp:Transcript_5406/g.19473  ORF Transcript_5406/g.19473 Transcript_5406/m.19473 type:complete len:231 (+) Transcript_5406:404-1096(+)